MQKYDSIIFDLDGTLWDSVETVTKIWNDALIKAGLEPTLTCEEFKRCMGLRIEQIFDHVIPDSTPEQRAIIKQNGEGGENSYLALHGGVLYDGLEETLAQLSKTHRLFIVSNCAEGYIIAFFQAHGLKRYFEDFECAGRTGKDKGDNIKLIVERCGLSNPVYIGDTVMDKEAADKAGIDFIHAAYGFGDVECEVKAMSVREIANLV